MPKVKEIQPREVVTLRNPKTLRVQCIANDGGKIDVQSVEANLLYEILTEMRETNRLLRSVITTAK